jgi:tRNA nucleotidyltransferase (CCA-adding enzyme)
MEVRRWLSRVGLEQSGAQLALAQAEAGASRDRAVRAEVKKLERAVAAAKAASPALSAQHLALDGRAVMAILDAGPGPHVGEALRHLLDRVLEDPSLNEAGALEAELRAWWLARKRPL